MVQQCLTSPGPHSAPPTPPPAPPPTPPPAPPLRLQLLLAEVHQLSGNVSQALVVATETVRQCAEHHWKALVAQGKLMIAQLQVSVYLKTSFFKGTAFVTQHFAISHVTQFWNGRVSREFQ